MSVHIKTTGFRPATQSHYAHIPALNGARFVFIEQPLWEAGLQWAKKRPYRSKANWDLDVLFGVTRLVHFQAVVVREATDKSVMLTATTRYLRSVGKSRASLCRISMSDIRRAEHAVGWRNVGRR